MDTVGRGQTVLHDSVTMSSRKMPPVNTAKLQRSHIRIADQGGLPNSTYNDTFIEHDINESKAEISQEKMNDLRRSHFSLAHAADAKTGTTETRTQYVPHSNAERQPFANLHGLKDNISNRLGYDEPIKESSYMAEYCRDVGQVKRTPLKKNLQASHFALGNDGISYVSEEEAVYSRRDQTERPVEESMNLRQSHLPIDEGNREYQTEFNANYEPISSLEREEYDLRRFEHSHIQLSDGLPVEQMSSTEAALAETVNASRSSINDEKQKARERFLRESHLPVAEDKIFHGESEMRASFPGRNDLKPADSLKPKYENTEEHVCFPEREGERISEMRANYVSMDNEEEVDKNREEANAIRKFMGRPTDPNCEKLSSEVCDGKSVNMVVFEDNKHLLEQVRKDREEFHLEANAHGKSAIELTDSSARNDYVTETRAMLDSSAQYAGKRLSAPMNNQLWRSDVMLKGNQADSYETENKAAYKKDSKGVSEHINEDMINELRKSHFALGYDEPDYKSVAETDIVGHDDYKDDGKYVGYTEKYEEQLFLM